MNMNMNIVTYSLSVEFYKSCLGNKRREILERINSIFLMGKREWDKTFLGSVVYGGVFNRDFYEVIKYELRNYIKEENDKGNIEKFSTDFNYVLKYEHMNKEIGKAGWIKKKLPNGFKYEEFDNFHWYESLDDGFFSTKQLEVSGSRFSEEEKKGMQKMIEGAKK